MMNESSLEQLREISWRRKLTSAEQASLSEWLAAHPEAQAEWETEAGLNQVLAGLPNVPVASNFTARVVEAAQREADGAQRGAKRSKRSVIFWMRWLPKTALGTVILAAGLISYNHIQSARRAEWAQSLATVAEVPSLPSPDILKDFDAIAALGSTPPADEELLKL